MPQPRFQGTFRKAGEANRRRKCSERLQNIKITQKLTPHADNDESATDTDEPEHSESFTHPDYGPPAKKKLQWDEGRRIVELKVTKMLITASSKFIDVCTTSPIQWIHSVSWKVPNYAIGLSKCFRAGFYTFSRLKFKVNNGTNSCNLCFKMKTKTYLVSISIVTIHSACHC